MNQRGSAVITLAVAASTVIAISTLAVFVLSRQVSEVGARTVASHLADEQIKNALIYTKKLIDSGCLAEEKPGTWTVAADCPENREWSLKVEDAKPFVKFSLCASTGGAALEVGVPASPEGCRMHEVKVGLLELVAEGRRRVNVRTTAGRFSSVATALVDAAPAPTPVPSVTAGE